MTAPLVFMDTETTGLSLDDDVWEFAGIRREPDGTETELHLFIEHNEHRCARLPEAFLKDHRARYDEALAVSRGTAAGRIYRFLAPHPEHGPVHIVGAVPNFDTERLTLLLERHDRTWPAHYHLVDVENLAVGFLAARTIPSPRPILPPWDSDELSELLGVEPMGEERHTAMGDARWARAIFDRVMSIDDVRAVADRIEKPSEEP